MGDVSSSHGGWYQSTTSLMTFGVSDSNTTDFDLKYKFKYIYYNTIHVYCYC